MVRFGYNWDTGSVSLDIAIPAMQASKASAHLIMFASGNFFLHEGELATIRAIAEQVPDCKLIIRNYHPAEGNWVLYPSASEYESHWAWIRLKLGDSLMQRIIFDDPSNEPNLNGADRLTAKAYVARCILLAKSAANAGVKIAIAAFSVGQPHESLINSEYSPLWKALEQYRQAISLHLYGCIPFEAGELVPYATILDARTARDAILGKWPSNYQGWLIGRAYRIIQAFESLGLGLPELYVTECLIDQISDMGQVIKEQWKAKYGIVKYQKDPRGVQSWESYLKEMYPELDFDESVAKLLSHARRNILYSPAFKGACLFALNAQWGYPDGSNREAGSNYADSQFTRFRATLLPAINAESLEDTMPDYPLYPANFRSLIVSNVRATNDVDSVILYTLDTNVQSGYIAKEGEKMLGSVFDGLAIQFLHPATQQMVSGFIAKTKNLVIDYRPDVPAPKRYRLESDGATQIVSEETWLALIKYHELRAASLKTILPE